MNPSLLTVAASAAAVLLVATTGCNSDDANADPEPTPFSPVETEPKPKSIPTLSPEEREVLSTYRRFNAVADQARLAGNWTRLKRLQGVAVDTAFLAVRRSILDYERRDQRVMGRIRYSPKVTKLNRRHAEITDCLDVSDFRVVEKKTGKPVELIDPDGNPLPDRYRATVILENRRGNWYVTLRTPHQERPC